MVRILRYTTQTGPVVNESELIDDRRIAPCIVCTGATKSHSDDSTYFVHTCADHSNSILLCQIPRCSIVNSSPTFSARATTSQVTDTSPHYHRTLTPYDEPACVSNPLPCLFMLAISISPPARPPHSFTSCLPPLLSPSMPPPGPPVLPPKLPPTNRPPPLHMPGSISYASPAPLVLNVIFCNFSFRWDRQDQGRRALGIMISQVKIVRVRRKRVKAVM